ncbi:hypothetical protein BDC45DRAFT_594880 [Circinella umbellata]|nr:hypothetical protein BDC45DRAFT_594880 [Circinella umbellata]
MIKTFRKMYIEYSLNQRSADDKDTNNYRLSVKAQAIYRPPWLIRTSDWKRVPGIEAQQTGYCALSYCWIQSGEIISKKEGIDNGADNSTHSNSEFDYIDRGQHKLIGNSEVYNDPRSRNKFKSLFKQRHSNDKKNKIMTTITTRHVTFEGLLQQLCKDFQIEYLWYDKICIDQTNEEEKLQNIKKMYYIYSSANYTVALVPEIKVDTPQDFDQYDIVYGNLARGNAVFALYRSLWFKRSWTLTEVMLSRHILVVGQNINFWQQSCSILRPSISDLLAPMMDIFNSPMPNDISSVNNILRFAHFRTSSNKHDQLFALLNILYPIIPGVRAVLDTVNTSYESIDIQQAYKDIYRVIPTDDLSILCFGSREKIIFSEGPSFNTSTMDEYTLPSWTGVGGLHLSEQVLATTYYRHMSAVVDSDMCLRIQVYTYGSIYPVPVEQETLVENREDFIRLRNRVKQMDPIKHVNDIKYFVMKLQLSMISSTGCYPTHCLLDQSKNGFCAPAALSLTEEVTVQDECIVLPIVLESCRQKMESAQDARHLKTPLVGEYTSHCFLPVIKRNKDGCGKYRAIGIYYLGKEDRTRDVEYMNNLIADLFGGYNYARYTTFIIE